MESRVTDKDRRIDGLRYAIFQRVASSIRHDVAGRLHPLTLMADVIHHQLAPAAPDIEALRRNAGILQAQIKKEAPALTRMATWIEPREDAVIFLDEGVKECLALLAVDFGLCGVRLDNRVDAPGISVRARVLNLVLTAAMLAALDAAEQPCEFIVEASADKNRVALLVTCSAHRAAMTREGHTSVVTDHPLTWSDVALLAAAEGVDFTRQDAAVTLRFASAS